MTSNKSHDTNTLSLPPAPINFKMCESHWYLIREIRFDQDGNENVGTSLKNLERFAQACIALKALQQRTTVLHR